MPWMVLLYQQYFWIIQNVALYFTSRNTKMILKAIKKQIAPFTFSISLSVVTWCDLKWEDSTLLHSHVVTLTQSACQSNDYHQSIPSRDYIIVKDGEITLIRDMAERETACVSRQNMWICRCQISFNLTSEIEIL